ncbi:MAG: HlyD family secretion protein, partial [Deltaproteobacteria bacterium]|nr:HlyD family secretion protein [Deltaproteobacteria bacterium]
NHEIETGIQAMREDFNQAKAAYEEARIQRDLTHLEETRFSSLIGQRSISQGDYDNVHFKWLIAVAHTEAARAAISKSEAALRNSEAKLKTQKIKIEEAKSALALADLNLKRTEIRAPVSGWVANKDVDPGRYVQPGQALLTITKDEEFWVMANFKETQIGKMKVGQS